LTHPNHNHQFKILKLIRISKTKVKTVGEVAAVKEDLVHNGAVKMDIVVAKDGVKTVDAIKLQQHVKDSIAVLLLLNHQHHRQKMKQKNSKTKVKTVGEVAATKEDLVHNGAVEMDIVVAKDGEAKKETQDATRLFLLARTSIVVL